MPQTQEQPKLIPSADRIAKNKTRILLLWEKRVREKIPQTANQPHPILVDTLPKFLDNLVDSLRSPGEGRLPTDDCTIAHEHGGERARITNYNLDCLFTEYSTLRETIFEVLDEYGPISNQERRLIRQAIDEANKQSAMSFTLVLEGIREQFMATLTHDLRGPITAAKANIDMILLYPDKKERHAHFATKAVENLKRIDKMISDLLDVSKLHAGESLTFKMSECDAVAVTRQACEELATAHGERIRFQCTLSSFRTWWNPEAYRRVIENLVDNAVKYGAPEAPITVNLSFEHGRAVLTVHNYGHPIPIEEQETLFKAFKRASRARKGQKRGWGLGLALVRGVAEGHGGSIIVQSSSDKGTVIGIDILQDARHFKDNRVLAS